MFELMDKKKIVTFLRLKTLIIWAYEVNLGLDVRVSAFRGLGTTKSQTSLRSLFSDDVIPLLESIISRLAISEISVF